VVVATHLHGMRGQEENAKSYKFSLSLSLSLSLRPPIRAAVQVQASLGRRGRVTLWSFTRECDSDNERRRKKTLAEDQGRVVSCAVCATALLNLLACCASSCSSCACTPYWRSGRHSTFVRLPLLY
jgi:hypothetical protein